MTRLRLDDRDRDMTKRGARERIGHRRRSLQPLGMLGARAGAGSVHCAHCRGLAFRFVKNGLCIMNLLAHGLVAVQVARRNMASS